MFNITFRLSVVLSLLISVIAWCQPRPVVLQGYPDAPRLPLFLERASPWADSVYLSLSLRERIAQLFVISAYSNQNEKSYRYLEQKIKKENVGGLIFFQGGPVRQASLTNRYQKIAKTPLMIAMDAEWGVNMRMEDSIMSYPQQMQLGAIKNDSLIREYGKQIGKQCNALGININFAPVVDVNNNPYNPVINTRSFGEMPDNVARKGWAYANGLQQRNVLPVAKHFPGHGDTNKDSHKTLPKVAHNRQRLDSIELYPFRHLIQKGVGGIMNAHLYVPALDPTPGQASSISPKIVGGLLRGELNFKGLAFTDALGMQGLAAHHSLSQRVVKAFVAGNDVLLMPKNLTKAIDAIEKAIQSGEINKRDVDQRCHKILKAKEWMALDKFGEIDAHASHQLINNAKSRKLRQALIEASIAVVENKDSLLPLQDLHKLKIASLAIGNGRQKPFQRMLSQYTDVAHFSISKYANQTSYNSMLHKLKNYDVVLLSFHNTLKRASKGYGITQRALNFMAQLNKKSKVVATVFATPYALRKFKQAHVQALLLGHRDESTEQKAAAQLIFGGLPACGQMPVTAGDFKAGTGFCWPKQRFAYPSASLDNAYQNQKIRAIDSLVQQAIKHETIPGCQILAAYKGRVLLNKSYGYHTYAKRKKVKNTDLYDLASITKISSTLFSIMHLVETGQLNLEGKLSDYYSKAKNTNKANLRIEDLLLHQAGLVSWIPFFREGIQADGSLAPSLYAKVAGGNKNTKVARNMYILDSYNDTIVQRILSTKLQNRVYRYSDLGFILLKEMVEEITQKPIDEFADSILFKPLATRFCFNPWNAKKQLSTPPTEYDHSFRKQVIQAYAHDQTAAQLGGVSGHAGLFGSALDLAKLMQLFLQNGTYGGKKFLSRATIYEFTRCHYCLFNRRGLGFDKPSIEGGVTTSDYASQSSFGHSGYTGGYTWADPKHQLLYVFLTNRTYPKADNNKIIKENLRTRILDLLYEAVHENTEGKRVFGRGAW